MAAWDLMPVQDPLPTAATVDTQHVWTQTQRHTSNEAAGEAMCASASCYNTHHLHSPNKGKMPTSAIASTRMPSTITTSAGSSCGGETRGFMAERGNVDATAPSLVTLATNQEQVLHPALAACAVARVYGTPVLPHPARLLDARVQRKVVHGDVHAAALLEANQAVQDGL